MKDIHNTTKDNTVHQLDNNNNNEEAEEKLEDDNLLIEQN